MTVRELLALDAEAQVVSAVPQLAANSLHRAAVLRAGHLAGVVSLGNVVRAASVRGGVIPG